MDAVLNSTVAGVLSRANGGGGGGGTPLTSETVASLRNESTVRCGFFGNGTAPCEPFKRPCLFNVARDPCERVNLNHAPGRDVERLVRAKIDGFERSLRRFAESARPPGNVRATKDADPARHDGTWTNWEDRDVVA